MYRPCIVLMWSLLSGQLYAAGFVDQVGLGDRLLVIAGGIVVLLVTLYCIKCFVRPGEKDSRHIKRRILKDE